MTTSSATSQSSDRSPEPRASDTGKLESLARLIRHHILVATTHAGSGHPSSSLSAVELMAGLFFGGTFRYDPDHPEHPNNDRLIFSKGHASPLLYALYLAAGRLSDKEMLTYRDFGSQLEGHPTPDFAHAEAATGSLGQGLAIGLGMAINGKFLDKLPYRTYVLLGDSEMAEGSQWEALALAAHYKLDNLVGILDVNRLGQCGETMLGHDIGTYEARIKAFGWETLAIDGHDYSEVLRAYEKATMIEERPTMIIARTRKGRGVSIMEDREGWHGKALSPEKCQRALEELGDVDLTVRGEIARPGDVKPERPVPREPGPAKPDDAKEKATRAAYGTGLGKIYAKYPQIVSLDAEVSNSTKAEAFGERHPDRFFEMYIAEQNMVGAALGLARRGKLPFVSTFAAFMTRAYDQIRMAQYSEANIKFVGSHAGVAIGEDGPSQMGLEDIAMFRSIRESVVLHPCDAVSTEKLLEEMARHVGISYLRTLRQATPLLYSPEDEFTIGGSRVLRESGQDVLTVVAAGTTVHEALEAHTLLNREGHAIRVIDAYSIKPLDEETLRKAAEATGRILTVEDHYPAGGLGEAVASALAGSGTPIFSLAVHKKPHSGKPEELLSQQGIDAESIVAKVKELACN